MAVDCHIHMALDGGYWRDALKRHMDAPDERFIRETLERYQKQGFTYLRDGGDRWDAGLRASQIAAEYGITYRTPCFPICRKGHYGGFIGKGFETIEEFRKLVKEVRQRGGHFIKLMISGLMDFDHYGVLTDEPMPEDLILETTKIAHGEGFSVMAHANGDEAVQGAVKAGIDSVEHGAYLSDETLRMLAESKTVWVPTLAPVGDLIGDERFPESVTRPLLAYQMNAVKKAAELGAFIASGSDAGAYRVHHVQGGLEELAFLRTALGENADEILSRGAAEIQARF